ncbi:MAG TPA: PQQ-binding-like beta-propeller repeat protein [Verrucomicrobiae bacterium]|nr:PQQ-binding-like beta-propeller repeat protein [Verrucomicrobiae bacterium]
MKPTRLLLAFLFAVSAAAENWPAWRGPTGQGISSEKNLPTRWSTNENVKWRVPLPDRGNSTPIVWKERIFLTQAITSENKRVVMCLNRDDGKILWQAGPIWTKEELTHETNPQAAGSPVTDGERVIAFLGSAGIYCYDFKGKEIWKRDLGAQRHIWGYGSSPVIVGDVCYLNFGPGPRQFLIALDKKTGKTLWQVDTPGGASGEASGDKKAEWVGSWSTPVLIGGAGKEQLLLSWPERLVSYNLKTGAEIWTCRGLNPLAYTSPLYADGIAVAMGGFGGKDFAVKVDGAGDVTDTHRIWDHPKTKQRIGSGAIHDGHIYIHEDPGVAECIELKTGKTIWEERLKGAGASGVNWSSVMIADGNCYTITQGGDCFVFKASPKFEVVATNSLREASNSSIVPSEGQLFIRTHKALWCIANTK